jgi:hypothetical protein
MVSNAERDRWRRPQCLMDAAEIIMRHVEYDCRDMVVELLAKGVCQPRESPARHAERKVSAFRVAGRNLCGDAAYYVASYSDFAAFTGWALGEFNSNQSFSFPVHEMSIV